MISPSTHETLAAKEKFEFKCRDYGVIVLKYLSDNGTAFTSHEYSQHLALFEQIQRFAGVGAHHHNGAAEKAIQDIMSIARTILLHAAIHWPEVADAQLWPMAVDYAVFIYNHMPRETTGLSPHDIFTRQRWPHAKFHDLHVFGCPVYVLDKHIADGHKLPHWKPRAQRQIFVGFSKDQASTVPLILNPATGAITPQYHVVFDDYFATVTSNTKDLPDFNSDDWLRLFGDSVYQYPVDDLVEDSTFEPGPPPVPYTMDSHDIQNSSYVPNPSDERPSQREMHVQITQSQLSQQHQQREPSQVLTNHEPV